MVGFIRAVKAPLKKVYFAGPDVFSPNYHIFMEIASDLCSARGLEPLFPFWPELKTATEIFRANVALLDEADGVIANVQPFRGTEPDSGTSWEIGYAYARKLPCVLFTTDSRSVRRRAYEYNNVVLNDQTGPLPDGFEVENFGSPVNLMLSESGKMVIDRDPVHRAIKVMVLKLTGIT